MSATARVLIPLGRNARNVAAVVVGGIWPGKTAHDVLIALCALPFWRQVGLVSLVLGLLFFLALFAAQFGIVGLAVYFSAAVLIAL